MFQSSLARTFVALNLLLASVLAAYPPVAPIQGSYRWELVITDSNGQVSYTGGKTFYDYVSGYVRMESWNTKDANPGINGITLWDLREQQPILFAIDENANCFSEKLDSNVSAPQPWDFTGYKYIKLKYFNRALTEEWSDTDGNVVYVDVFARDIVGWGNVNAGDDGETLFYNVYDWSDEKPDGTEFLLPNTVPCKPVNMLENYRPVRFQANNGLNANAVKCAACKAGIGLVIGRLCTGVGAAACAAFPPSIPFCAVLASLACKVTVGKLTSLKACQIIRLC